MNLVTDAILEGVTALAVSDCAIASASVASSTVPFRVVEAGIDSRRFAPVILLSSPLIFTAISSVSVKVVQAPFREIDFLICVGVTERTAPVVPVNVQAVTSASVAISTIPDTVVEASGVGVPTSRVSHCAVPVL